MSSSFERFLAGEDALARLIRNQPAFTPSAEQEARLLAAIAALPQTAPEGLEFEPPAHMEAAFLQDMRAIQQAQAPRRDALLQRLQQGESADAIFGHPIDTTTQDWLARQQASTSFHTKTPQTKPRNWR